KLFPEYVVNHMVSNQPNPLDPDPNKRPLIPQENLPGGYYYLPNEEKLPVVVCTRMSLSFPILLSAVPLYTLSTQAYNDFRERIVQIRLNKDEGGLNLAMPKAIIDKVVSKGQEAGATLCKPDEFNFDHHVWVRFLVLMAQLEDQILGMQEVLKSPDFEHRLEQQLKMSLDPKSRYPYWKDAPWTENVTPRVAAMLDLIKHWNISPV